MNKYGIRVAAGAGLAAVSLAGLGIGIVAASGDGAPPADADKVGALTLEDSGGKPVTSGTLASWNAVAAVGDAKLPAGTRAVLYAYAYGAPAPAPSASPGVKGYAPAGAWSGSELGAADTYTGTPTASIDSTTETLQQFLSAYPSTGLVELRLRTISPGQPLSAQYDALDVYVDSAAGTWSTTPGSGSPSSSAPGGPGTTARVAPKVTLTLPASVPHTARATLRVAVTAKGVKTVTGKVTIYNGSKKVARVALKAGAASYRLPALTKGVHTIKVVYGGSSTVKAKTVTKKITSR